MTPLDPLPNLIDQVYARILEAITDRSLPPGHRIRQNELAERLGVSRQPVSHALHLLHRQGLVAESGRRGFEVTRLRSLAHPPALRGARRHRRAGGTACCRTRQNGCGRAGRGSRRRCTAGRAIHAQTSLTQLIALDVDFLPQRHSPAVGQPRNRGNDRAAVARHMRRSMAGPCWPSSDYRDSAWTRTRKPSPRRILAGNAKGAETAALAHAQTAGRDDRGKI